MKLFAKIEDVISKVRHWGLKGCVDFAVDYFPKKIRAQKRRSFFLDNARRYPMKPQRGVTLIAERIAVLVHVFYPQFWSDLLNCIRCFKSAFGAENVRVMVTLAETVDDGFEKVILSDYPQAVVMRVPNCGYDVAPFFLALNRISLDDFDYVVKLHTKRDLECCYVNFRPLYGSEFRKACLAFCSSGEAIQRLKRCFETRLEVGMIASERMIDPSGFGSCRDPWKNASVLADVGIKPTRYAMVLGTMFAVRAKILKPLWRRYAADDFPRVTRANAHHEYGKAILWEGAFGMMVIAEGYRISSGRLPPCLDRMSFFFWGVVFRVIRFVMTALRFFCSDRFLDRVVRWR